MYMSYGFNNSKIEVDKLDSGDCFHMVIFIIIENGWISGVGLVEGVGTVLGPSR